MNEYVYLLILIPILILAFLVGCSPVSIDEPPEPIISIHIKPEYSDITLGDSITFFVKADNYYIELSRSVN